MTLLRRADGTGRIAAYETLVGVPAVRNLIREAKTHQIASMIQTGSRAGMISLDQSMANLVKSKMVTEEEAMSKAEHPRELAAILEETKDGGKKG